MQNQHEVTPSFISILYNHLIQLGTQEQEERTIFPATVLIVRSKRRDSGDK